MSKILFFVSEAEIDNVIVLDTTGLESLEIIIFFVILISIKTIKVSAKKVKLYC